MGDESAEPDLSSSEARSVAKVPSTAGVRGSAVACSENDSEEMGIIELGSVVVKRWKMVVGLPLGTALVAAIVSLLIPVKYTATASFVPERESRRMTLPGELAGLAAQLGVGAGGGSESPKFYGDVLQSRTLQDQVLEARFRDPRTVNAAADGSARLLDILHVNGETETERLEAGRKKLRKAMAVRVDKETGVVRVALETGYPELSAAVVNLLVELLNQFNLETRQSKGEQRRRFVEERLGEAGRELDSAEGELKRFLERNRQFEGSPELAFQYERLQRRVRIKEEVLTTLHRQYEEARIQEVNDTPLITVIDEAIPPQRKSSPRRKLIVGLAFLLGTVTAFVGAFSIEYIEQAGHRGEASVQEFASRWGGMKAEMKSLIRGRLAKRGA